MIVITGTAKLAKIIKKMLFALNVDFVISIVDHFWGNSCKICKQWHREPIFVLNDGAELFFFYVLAAQVDPVW